VSGPTKDNFALKSQRGLTLIETAIAVLLLAIVATGILTGIRTAVTIGIRVDDRETAKNLAESEMEHVKSLGAFTTTYEPLLISGYDQFSVTITVSPIPSRDFTDIQRVTVVVTKRGKVDPLISLSNYKVMR
jgi:prepilin-type N-terminal cleavage/methylation domain-containing protein